MPRTPYQIRKLERGTVHFMQVLGRRFYKLRNRREFTVRFAAHKLKITPSILEKIENGTHKNFQIGRLYKICRFYCVDPLLLIDVKATFTVKKYSNKMNLISKEKANEHRQKIGAYFLKLRKARKETILVTAKNLKMASAVLSMIEKGTYKNFNFPRFLIICNYYNVNPLIVLETECAYTGIKHLFTTQGLI